MDDCLRLRTLLRDERLELSELLRELAALQGVEGCIQDDLRLAADAADRDAFEGLLWAAFRHPSAGYAPTLEEVLYRQLPEVSNEDLIEILGMLGQESSVEPLRRALYWRPESDEFHSLAVKCVGALAAIGTPSARRVLEGLSPDEPAVIRDWAERKLSSTAWREE